MTAYKENLFNCALIINHLDQIESAQNLPDKKKAFQDMVNSLGINPGKDPLDSYIYFTANKDTYQKTEALQIEKELLAELKSEIEYIRKANLN
jgi:hypothetical protein